MVGNSRVGTGGATAMGVIFGLVSLLGISGPAVGGADLVDLEFRPVTQTVGIGDTVEVGLYAVATGATREVFSIQAIVDWDPQFLGAITLHRAGEPLAMQDGGSAFTLPHPSGLNDELDDGDALYFGNAELGDSFPVTSAGTLIVTFRFPALAGTSGTVVDILEDLPLPFAETRVVSAVPAGGNITGELFFATVEITCVDALPPELTIPDDVTIECDESTDPSNPLLGEAEATDDCDDDPTVTFTDSVAAGACAQESVITRTWKATDSGGNMTTDNQIITVVDTTSPVVIAPMDIDINADAGGCSATLTEAEIGTPTATDNCSDVGDLIFDGFVRSDGETTLTAPFDSADSPITIEWKFKDECDNVGSAFQTVIVAAVNDVVLDVAFLGAVQSPLSRCIRMRFYRSAGGSTLVTADLTFSAGSFSGTIEIPCHDYDCLNMRDALHSLRTTLNAADGFGIVGTQYVADHISAGKDLILGNLNNDEFVDIIDFGIFSGQWNLPLAASTCATGSPHSDIDGNGFVFTEDFAVIQGNYLATREPNCIGGLGPVRQPVTRISLEELRRRGLGHLVVADLTHDGWLDELDMVAFMMGARPEKTDLNPGGGVPDALKKHDGNVRWEPGRDVQLREAVRIDDRDIVARDVTVGTDGRLILADASLEARHLSLEAGATLVVDGGVLSLGSLDIDPGATLAWTGGTIEIVGGSFEFAGAELRLGHAGVSNALWLDAGAHAHVAEALIGLHPEDDGELVVRASTFSTDGLLLVGGAGMGRLHVADGGVVVAGVRMVVGDHGIVTGDSLIIGDLDSQGLVAPAGILTVAGAYTQDRFAGELALGDDDRLVVNGPAFLGGRLSVTLKDSALVAGDRMTLIEAVAVEGRFDHVDVIGLDAERFEVQYREDGVVLVVTE